MNFPSKVKRLTIDTFVLVRKPEEKVTCSRKEKPKNLFFSYEITFHKMKNGERKNKLFSWFLCVCILFLALLQARGKKEKKKGHWLKILKNEPRNVDSCFSIWIPQNIFFFFEAEESRRRELVYITYYNNSSHTCLRYPLCDILYIKVSLT